jgi:hypothetical protein
MREEGLCPAYHADKDLAERSRKLLRESEELSERFTDVC